MIFPYFTYLKLSPKGAIEKKMNAKKKRAKKWIDSGPWLGWLSTNERVSFRRENLKSPISLTEGPKLISVRLDGFYKKLNTQTGQFKVPKLLNTLVDDGSCALE